MENSLNRQNFTSRGNSRLVENVIEFARREAQATAKWDLRKHGFPSHTAHAQSDIIYSIVNSVLCRGHDLPGIFVQVCETLLASLGIRLAKVVAQTVKTVVMVENRRIFGFERYMYDARHVKSKITCLPLFALFRITSLAIIVKDARRLAHVSLKFFFNYSRRNGKELYEFSKLRGV